MTKHILLTGAGFSANWGGWLANQLWAVLYGHQKVQDNDKLKEILWRYMERGGFEEAYEYIKASFPKLEPIIRKVIEDSFDEMNSKLDITFSKKLATSLISCIETLALSRGSYNEKGVKVFTLNQDIYFERAFLEYCQYMSKVYGNNRQLYLPYIQNGIINCNRDLSKISFDEVNDEFIKEDFSKNYTGRRLTTEYYKLHGSINFKKSDKKILVIGTSKQNNISKNLLLSKYHEDFEEALNAGDVRILIIGYSFNDYHINEKILNAAEKNGLKFFIITKDSLSDIVQNIIFQKNKIEPDLVNGVMAKMDKPLFDKKAEKIFRDSLISHSNCTLSEVFEKERWESVEQDRILKQFFND
jgi:hypothetical protein